MAERGSIKLNLQRGAEVSEFARFLNDLESAYFALLYLPDRRTLRRLRHDYFMNPSDAEFFVANHGGPDFIETNERYPKDQLEISRIRINSPGWVELVGALNPLQQLREYLKDRHERSADRSWRHASQKERALLENAILREQAERERFGTIREFYEMLEQMDVSPEMRQRMLWERLGPVMMRLGHHQDTGLIGTQNDEIDQEGI